MKHLDERQMASLAGGEAGWLSRWHASRCAECAAGVAKFRAVREVTKSLGSELPAGLDWESLSREMRANILVGVEAAGCVAPRVEDSPSIGWRPAVAFASVVAVVLTGWYLSAPKLVAPPFASVAAADAVVEATPAGLEWKRDGRGFAMLNPRANRVSYSVSAQGAEARAVDYSGQMTITHVVLD
ncbi:MAG: hypothetical protein SFV18_21025 [Bryobacteraceae bacterium]|nr:hypothetical protein [Bryobacteraceae bacterium]